VDETGNGYEAGAVKEHAMRLTAAWHVPVAATRSAACTSKTVAAFLTCSWRRWRWGRPRRRIRCSGSGGDGRAGPANEWDGPVGQPCRGCANAPLAAGFTCLGDGRAPSGGLGGQSPRLRGAADGRQRLRRRRRRRRRQVWGGPAARPRGLHQGSLVLLLGESMLPRPCEPET